MLSIFVFLLRSHIKIVLETKTAEKRLIKSPSTRVTANPRIGPDPYM